MDVWGTSDLNFSGEYEATAERITETEITENSISTPLLKANAVTAEKIAADTITGNEISSATTIIAGTGENTAGMNGLDEEGDPLDGIRFWSGADKEAPENASFLVDSHGNMIARNAELIDVTASGGSFNNIEATGGVFTDITATGNITANDIDADSVNIIDTLMIKDNAITVPEGIEKDINQSSTTNEETVYQNEFAGDFGANGLFMFNASIYGFGGAKDNSSNHSTTVRVYRKDTLLYTKSLMSITVSRVTEGENDPYTIYTKLIQGDITPILVLQDIHDGVTVRITIQKSGNDGFSHNFIGMTGVLLGIKK